MKDRYSHEHLSAERIQAFLEGELAGDEHAPAEDHLTACARCSAELDGWRLLMRRLDELPSLAPSEGFAEGTLARLRPSLSLVVRIRARLAGAEAAHPHGGRVHDLVEGLLPARQAARVQAHLDACPACTREAAAWRSALAGLRGLERLAPSEGFAARVMAGVRVPAPARAAVVPEWRRALAWAGRLVPRTRRAWAAVSGVALTPAVTLGLVLWTVFTHPTLTPGALASFTWWKVSELAALTWQTVASSAMESASLFGVLSWLGSLAPSPVALAGAFTAFSAATVAAAWVLYRNLVTAHPEQGRIAHVSLS